MTQLRIVFMLFAVLALIQHSASPFSLLQVFYFTLPSSQFDYKATQRSALAVGLKWAASCLGTR